MEKVESTSIIFTLVTADVTECLSDCRLSTR